jgi:hypothetical protein
MSARDHVKIAALAFALDAVSALRPGVWRRYQRSQRKRMERPVRWPELLD